MNLELSTTLFIKRSDEALSHLPHMRYIESMNTSDAETISRLHKEACEAQEQFYVDPASGLLVQTEFAHKKRGSCCTSGCRHCPYGYTGSKKKE